MPYRFHTTKQRSSLMSKIRSNNTRPEVEFRKKLWSRGIRFCRNKTNLPGNPDVVIKKYKIALFVDGEFWHGYNWSEKKKTIKSNRAYWIPKIERNIARDKVSAKELRRGGWIVLRFWQNAVDRRIDQCILKVGKAIEKRRAMGKIK